MKMSLLHRHTFFTASNVQTCKEYKCLYSVESAFPFCRSLVKSIFLQKDSQHLHVLPGIHITMLPKLRLGVVKVSEPLTFGPKSEWCNHDQQSAVWALYQTI